MEKIGNVYRLVGLSGAGKTTVGKMLYEYLRSKKENVVFLDGDTLRYIFSNDDYSLEGRAKQGVFARRMVKFLVEQGIDVVWCAIGMLQEERKLDREYIPNYKEIYLRVKLEELISRDTKGLYKGALENRIQNVYGVNMKTDYPDDSELVIDNENEITPQNAFDMILDRFNL